MKNKITVAFCTALMIFISALSACADASPTPTTKTIKREIKIGTKVAAEVEKQYPRVLDPAQEARLAMIASKLTPHMQRNLEYDVKIIELKEPNAFSLPGGRTYFTTGMLAFLKSEAEIAAVMAHEFVHADRAHGIVQSARNNRLSFLTIAGIIAATQGGGAAAMLLSSALQTAMMNSYSIDLEKEADARGIDALYKAGYNPAAMLTMMERLRIEKLKHAYVDPGIFQTHPETENRVEAALKYMKSKGLEVQRKDVVQSLKIDTVHVSGDVRLTVDGASLISLKDDPASSVLLEKLAARLTDRLELELAPYDLQVSRVNGGDVLMIRGREVLSAADLLPSMPTLAEIRNRINDALNKARRGNPLTDYFK